MLPFQGKCDNPVSKTADIGGGFTPSINYDKKGKSLYQIHLLKGLINV